MDSSNQLVIYHGLQHNVPAGSAAPDYIIQSTATDTDNDIADVDTTQTNMQGKSEESELATSEDGETLALDAANEAEFRFFMALPTELRVTIWKLAFRHGGPRFIELLRTSNDQRTWCSAPPITLWVNQESREEMLRHYKLLPFPEVISQPWDGRHSYVGIHDTIYMSWVNLEALVSTTSRDALVSWIQSIKATFSTETLSNIRRLEVRGVDLNYERTTELRNQIQWYLGFLFHTYEKTDNSPVSVNEHVIRRRVGILNLFPNLEILYLTEPWWVEDYYETSIKEKGSILEVVQEEINSYKGLFVDQRAPRVIYRDFQALPVPES